MEYAPSSIFLKTDTTILDTVAFLAYFGFVDNSTNLPVVAEDTASDVPAWPTDDLVLQDKWMKVWEAVSVDMLTQTEAAKRFNMSRQWVSSICRSAARHLAMSTDKEQAKEGIKARLQKQMRELEELKAEAKGKNRVNDLVRILAEQRKVAEAMGTLDGIGAKVQIDNSKKTYNVKMPEFNKVKTVEPEV